MLLQLWYRVFSRQIIVILGIIPVLTYMYYSIYSYTNSAVALHRVLVLDT